jgi:hypothetical protein
MRSPTTATTDVECKHFGDRLCLYPQGKSKNLKFPRTFLPALLLPNLIELGEEK